jgi:hypothetical protein
MKIPDSVNKIWLIGDIHDQYYYWKLAAYYAEKEGDYTIQIGDFGINFDVMSQYDKNKHMLLGGNHDNYFIIKDCPNYIGDYGIIEWNDKKLFYIRGAHSIDKEYQERRGTWWREEQLETAQMNDALDLYVAEKPDAIISHSPPHFAVKWFVDPIGFSATERLLTAMIKAHKPKAHFFGHMHIDLDIEHEGVNYYCVGMHNFLPIVPNMF